MVSWPLDLFWKNKHNSTHLRNFCKNYWSSPEI